MTLILGLVTPEFAVLVSDRRITRWDGANLESQEDTENKAVVLYGHFLLGYAGNARLGAIDPDPDIAAAMANPAAIPALVEKFVSTEAWIVRTISAVGMHGAFRHLREATDRLLGPTERHGYLAVGYLLMSEEDSALTGVLVEVRNAPDTAASGETVTSLQTTHRVIQGADDFFISSLGVPLDTDELADLDRRIREVLAGDPLDSLGAAACLVDVVQGIGDDVMRGRDTTVSSQLSVTILPRSDVPANGVGGHFGPVPTPVTTLTSFYVPDRGSVHDGSQYMPAVITEHVQMFGGEVHIVTRPEVAGQSQAHDPPPR